jgi:hypothetical protein
MTGYLKYAQSLAFDQWKEEYGRSCSGGDKHDDPVWSGIWRAIRGISDSFAQSEPMTSIVKRLHLVLPGEANIWSLDGVSISDKVSLSVSFEYLVHDQEYARHWEIMKATGVDLLADPFEGCMDAHVYFFDVSAVLHINDSGEVFSSEILDICAHLKEQ